MISQDKANRLRTMGSLLTHWGLGAILGAMAATENFRHAIWIGVGCLVIGGILGVLFPYRKS